jgi:hypothetical protein
MISAEKAKSLVDNGGDELWIDEPISSDAAAVLATFSGHLHLDGVVELTEAVARQLAEHSSYLELPSLKRLDSLAAEALSQHRGAIELSGLDTLDPPVAQALSKHRGDLAIRGISHLEEGSAAALGMHRGTLFLDSIKVLTSQAAASLSQHIGSLHLDALQELSDETASCLFAPSTRSYTWKNRNHVLSSRPELSLRGLRRVSSLALGMAEKSRWLVHIGALTELSESEVTDLRTHHPDVVWR